MKRVYIAGPYTKGDVAVNVKKAMEAAIKVLETGNAPFCPHLTHFLHIHSPQPYETWLAMDFEFVKVCDMVWRLEGESSGADREVALAKELKIPVYYKWADVWKEL